MWGQVYVRTSSGRSGQGRDCIRVDRGGLELGRANVGGCDGVDVLTVVPGCVIPFLSHRLAKSGEDWAVCDRIVVEEVVFEG